MLATLTFERDSLADLLGEVAFVVVGAITAVKAREPLTNACLLIAEVGGRAGVQSAGQLGTRELPRARRGFLTAEPCGSRSLRVH